MLIMNADLAMYHTKGSGKNNYMFFDASMMQKFNEKIQLENMYMVIPFAPFLEV